MCIGTHMKCSTGKPSLERPSGCRVCLPTRPCRGVGMSHRVIMKRGIKVREGVRGQAPGEG